MAILAANHPDYLVVLYACARLGALLVPLNWRLAVAEQLFILGNASAKVLLVQDAFASVLAPVCEAQPEVRIVRLGAARSGGTFDELLVQAHGDDRNPHVDGKNPLLLVYTSGTTGGPRAPCCARRRSFGTRS